MQHIRTSASTRIRMVRLMGTANPDVRTSGYVGIDDFARLKGHKYMSVSTTAFNNGLLEGTVNKIKAVKRSMFNSANTEVLRAKVLYNGMNGKGFTTQIDAAL